MPTVMPMTYGTTFKYGIKASQLTGLVVETFDSEKSPRVRVELVNESGQLVGLRLDDVEQKLSIAAIVTGTPPIVGDTITFAPEDAASSATGTKAIVTKVAISGSAGDKLKVKLDCEAFEHITLT